eukprot:6804704-Pyramimonas_sp.AAC.1
MAQPISWGSLHGRMGPSFVMYDGRRGENQEYPEEPLRSKNYMSPSGDHDTAGKHSQRRAHDYDDARVCSYECAYCRSHCGRHAFNELPILVVLSGFWVGKYMLPKLCSVV